MAMKVHSAGIHGGQPMQENAFGVQVKSESLPVCSCILVKSAIEEEQRP
jgi:hypothetical protein